MSKKKACLRCKLFTDQDACPQCGTSSFATSWQGRLFVPDPENSQIAGKIGIKNKGEYAIKVR